MRLVSAPCSETQALTASDRVSQGRGRREAAPSTYPDVRRRAPPPKNTDLEFFAGEVGRAAPPSTHAQHSRSPCSLCILLWVVNRAGTQHPAGRRGMVIVGYARGNPYHSETGRPSLRGGTASSRPSGVTILTGSWRC